MEIGNLELTQPVSEAASEIFSTPALAFVEGLVADHAEALQALMRAREERQQAFNQGELPDFLASTRKLRERDWSIRGIPDDLLDRRVEITGPTDRKMVINALNSGARVYMADFEDSLAPSWENISEGQLNLRDACNGTIAFTNPDNDKSYRLNDAHAVLICRVRGLHLTEKHVLYRGERIPGCLLDFGLYLYHNHRALAKRGTGPYFYVPKIQSHLEARWWDSVFAVGEDTLGLVRGTVKATFLIETLPAVFEMDEILYELRDHIVALNCGRWDYIFSYIKTLRSHPDRVLPDRQAVTMDKPFLDAYSRLLIRTCHRRGALAMGGMAAFIPSRDSEENNRVFAKVRDDKQREANNGHDGTWVAHPGLVPVATEILGNAIGENSENQLGVTRDNDGPITAEMLLEIPDGDRTEEGMRLNIRISVQYIEAWISGNGCVPIYGLMEDAATAEISRASIWQWIQNRKQLANGKLVTNELFRDFLAEEMQNIRAEVGDERFDMGRYTEAADLLDEFTTSAELAEFLTLAGYEQL